MIVQVDTLETLRALSEINSESLSLTTSYRYLLLGPAEEQRKLSARWETEMFETEISIEKKALVEALQEIPSNENTEIEFEFDADDEIESITVTSPCGDCLNNIPVISL